MSSSSSSSKSRRGQGRLCACLITAPPDILYLYMLMWHHHVRDIHHTSPSVFFLQKERGRVWKMFAPPDSSSVTFSRKTNRKSKSILTLSCQSSCYIKHDFGDLSVLERFRQGLINELIGCVSKMWCGVSDSFCIGVTQHVCHEIWMESTCMMHDDSPFLIVFYTFFLQDF